MFSKAKNIKVFIRIAQKKFPSNIFELRQFRKPMEPFWENRYGSAGCIFIDIVTRELCDIDSTSGLLSSN